MKRSVLIWTLAALLVTAAVAVVVVGAVLVATSGPGLTKQATARILVHDLKFGGRAQLKAISHGNAILPLIRAESADFAKLNGRNASWIGEVLGAIQTDESRAILLDLYARTNSLQKLTGAVGLAQHGLLPDEIDENSFLVRTARSELTQAERELAIIALGKSTNHAALPCLYDVLHKPAGYWHHARACEALARIGSRESIAVLRECLESPEFHALPEAFRALLALGDREAVPLAIARVSPELSAYNSGFIVRELKKVTGKPYEYDREEWKHWWDSAKASWQIPEQFLKPWDEQQDLY